jgi:predicted site-specific integrase-resolvase
VAAAVTLLDNGEVDDDLVRDMVEVLTSFCARLSAQDLPPYAVRAVRKVADAFAT